MTKFIEGAREIEMDAVAKNGKVCGLDSRTCSTDQFNPLRISCLLIYFVYVCLRGSLFR